MFTFVLAAVLLAVSLAIVLAILSVLWNALNLPVGRSLERLRFTRAQQRSRRGDAFLQRGEVEKALREFSRSFYLDAHISDRGLLSEVHNHHTGLLSRFIAVTDDLQGGTVRLMSLAKAERLLSERTDLQRRHLSLRDRRQRGALRDIQQKLRENRGELQACLKQLVAEIQASRRVQRLH